MAEGKLGASDSPRRWTEPTSISHSRSAHEMLVKQQKSDVPSSTAEEMGGLDSCGVQRPDSVGDICAAVTTQVEAELTAAGSLPRTMRRGRRKAKSATLTLAESAGEEGRDDSRGAQMTSDGLPGELGPTTTGLGEADPSRSTEQALAETMTATPYTDRGSSVPVHDHGAARLSQQRPRLVPEQARPELTGRVRNGTLSQQREFLRRRRRLADEDAHLPPLSILIVLGQRRRLVAEAEVPGERNLRLPRLDTQERMGCMHALEQKGRGISLSDRFLELMVSSEQSRMPAAQTETVLGPGRKRNQHQRRRSESPPSADGRLAAEPVVEPQVPQVETLSWAERRRRRGLWIWTRPAHNGGDVTKDVLSEGRPMAPAQERTGGLFLGNGSVADSTGDGPTEAQAQPVWTPAAEREGQEELVPVDTGDRNSERSDLDTDSAPESVEVRVITGKAQRAVVVLKSDWTEMMDLGMMMGPHPHLAVGLAWRRQYLETLPSSGVPIIRLVSHDAFDLPRNAWPTSWEGLVQHVEQGGFFRVTPVLRGGMDPAQQRLLDSAVFDDNLPWDVLDRAMDCVRSGQQVPPDVPAEMTSLAQALAGVVGLQQWDPLSTFLGNLPQDVREGLVLSPARLAALLVVARRRIPSPALPPAWVHQAPFTDLRIHHLRPEALVPEHQLSRDLKQQLMDVIINRLLSLLPEMRQTPQFKLQDLRADIRLELDAKAPGPFSATVVLPTGPWIDDLCQGTRSVAEGSFCTIGPADLYIETEASNSDQLVLRSIQSALGLDSRTFRLILDESLSRAFGTTVRSRSATARFIESGKGGKRTMEQVPPESPESRLMLTMDGTSLLLARRDMTRLPLRLGSGQEFPVTIGLNLPQCPHQALRSMLLPRDPASIKLRAPGTVIECPVILAGPLPKGSLPAQTVNSGPRMAEVRSSINNVCSATIGTKDVRFVGRFDKDRSPMFLCMEFPSVEMARTFGAVIDQQAPQEFVAILMRLCGDKAAQTQFWSSNLVSEVLAGAAEKDLKALLAHGQANPCPLPPPPPPPAQQQIVGQAASEGSGAAAAGPDNPEAARR